jgi:hypothetical protein
MFDGGLTNLECVLLTLVRAQIDQVEEVMYRPMVERWEKAIRESKELAMVVNTTVRTRKEVFHE